jgi:hypothetical protein
MALNTPSDAQTSASAPPTPSRIGVCLNRTGVVG